jgi:hypothetical protein
MCRLLAAQPKDPNRLFASYSAEHPVGMTVLEKGHGLETFGAGGLTLRRQRNLIYTSEQHSSLM